ncbi:unnamed protein product [Eruca vesicaria subsp. sativa]|uniref:AD domain-containing protein n=1 Tax=Eruca vesicaria subsp. sativa TaxID=29727 RepID=A0ABC8JD22_ERUVS|nr:unnamed protein product [Eruca vesicaria subsp. sativa]
MSPAKATEIEIAGGEEGDKFEVGKIYDVKLTTGIEFKGIVLAYDPDPRFVIFHILSIVEIITVVSSLSLRLVENIVGDPFRWFLLLRLKFLFVAVSLTWILQEGTIPETGDWMNTRMVNENFISTLTYIGRCKDPLASKERWIDLSGLEEKEAIAIREIESIGVTAEAQKVFNDLSKMKIGSIGVGDAAEAQKSFDASSKTYPMEQDLIVEILPFPVMRQDIIVAVNMGLKKKIFAQKISRASNGQSSNRKMKKMRKMVVGGKEKRPRERWLHICWIPSKTVNELDSEVSLQQQWFVVWTSKGKERKDGQNDRYNNTFQTRSGMFMKMTLLDIRYGNTDRNQGNILNKNGKLIPIDHGECFPKQLNCYRLDWIIWKMAEIPYLPEMVEYVKTLDVDKDLEILRTNGIELGERAMSAFRVQHLVLNLGVLGGNVPRDIGRLFSESLFTLVHSCTNPADVIDSLKGFLQSTRDIRTERESMIQREMSMLSREEKKTETKPRESRFSRTLRLNKVDGSKEEAIATREIKSIGVGVTAEAQKIFDAFSKTLHVQWVNKDILVWGQVRICSPYHDDCVTGGTTTAREQVKAVLKQVRQKLQLGTGGN